MFGCLHFCRLLSSLRFLYQQSRTEFIQLSNEVRVRAVMGNLQAGEDLWFGSLGTEVTMNEKGI